MRLSEQNKDSIRLLRSKGYTYREILQALDLAIPKSTLSYICRDIPMSKKYNEKILLLNKQHLSVTRKKALATNQKNRAKYLFTLDEKSRGICSSINLSGLKIALALLYLGEGAKWKSHAGLQLGSSEPTIIQLYIHLLKKCYQLDSTQLRCRVQYRYDQYLPTLERYWSKITGIPRRHFYKTIPDPRTKGKATEKQDYMGVCVISGGSTTIQLEFEFIAKNLLHYLGR